MLYQDDYYPAALSVDKEWTSFKGHRPDWKAANQISEISAETLLWNEQSAASINLRRVWQAKMKQWHRNVSQQPWLPILEWFVSNDTKGGGAIREKGLGENNVH